MPPETGTELAALKLVPPKAIPTKQPVIANLNSLCRRRLRDCDFLSSSHLSAVPRAVDCVDYRV
jgi:hypothetical protein